MSPYHVQKAHVAKGREAFGIRAEIEDAFGTFERFLEVAEAVRGVQSRPELPAAEHAEESVPEPEPEESVSDTRSQYDLDVAAVAAVKAWGYRSPGGAPLPVKLEYVRLLDAATRDWLHGIVWETMLPVVEGESAGN